MEKIFPAAVQERTEYLPDIMQKATKVELKDGLATITTSQPHGIQNGEMVRLITEKGGILYEKGTILNKTQFVVTAPIEKSIKGQPQNAVMTSIVDNK